MEQIFKIDTLGKLSLYLGNRQVHLSKQEQSKIVKMFLLLVMHPTEGISRSRLLHCLFASADNESDNLGGLRITTFRLRQALRQIGVPISAGEDYVIVRSGNYIFNPRVNIRVDALEFEEMALRIKDVRNKVEKSNIALKALELYKGRFLPNMNSEEWVCEEQDKLNGFYKGVFEAAFFFLVHSMDYKKAYELAADAAEIYPYEEYQIHMIDCLLSMNRNKEALTLYEETTNKYYAEMGLRPSEEMEKRLKLMSGLIATGGNLTIETVHDKLSEPEKKSGPYYSTLPGFIDTYRFVERLIGRTGQSAYVMTVSVEDLSNAVSDQRKQEISAALKTSIASSLRKGDTFTQYNLTTFMMLLMCINEAGCEIVIGRIKRAFQEANSFRKINIAFRKFPVINEETSDAEYALLAINSICICIDRQRSGDVEGRIYTRFSSDPIAFQGYLQLLKTLEAYYNNIGQPQKETMEHTFGVNDSELSMVVGLKPVYSVEEILKNRGDSLTVCLRVSHRFRSSWQGTAQFLERNVIKTFASELELIKLIEKTLSKKELMKLM